MSVIFILIIMLMRVVQSVYSKQTAIFLPDGLKPYVRYMAIYQGFATLFAAVALCFSGGFSSCNAMTVIIAACSGACLTIGSVCSLKALSGGTMVLNSVFSTAGLIIPCILGIFVFNEALEPIHAICILAVLFSTILLIDASKKVSGGFSVKTLCYLLASFISNGLVMFCQKLFGMMIPNGNVSMFSFITFLIPTVALMLFNIFIPKDESRAKFPKKLCLFAVCQAFAVFVIQQLVTLLTPTMHSAILFTLVNGSATIITAVVGAVMFREKLTAKTYAGIILGVGALIMINAI